MHALESVIHDNVARTRERIAAAAEAAGRDPGEVRLVGVTKYVDEVATRALFEAGVRDLAESRPQQLWAKAAALAEADIAWHLIGPLQRNKIRRTAPLVSLVHSCDDLRLLEALAAEGQTLGRPIDVLLEVNISGEAAKHGFAPDELPAALQRAAELPGARVRGLMGMASLEGGSAAAERNFRALAALRRQLQRACPAGVSLDELSMGMSGDYEIAIRHGATIVRIGSALFSGVERRD